MSTPLSTLLTQALVAFTIELDNEFERRFEQAGGRTDAEAGLGQTVM
jgi:hypothetical protein